MLMIYLTLSIAYYLCLMVTLLIRDLVNLLGYHGVIYSAWIFDIFDYFSIRLREFLWLDKFRTIWFLIINVLIHDLIIMSLMFINLLWLRYFCELASTTVCIPVVALFKLSWALLYPLQSYNLHSGHTALFWCYLPRLFI